VLGLPRQLEQLGISQHVRTVSSRDVKRVAGVQDLLVAVGVLNADLPLEDVVRIPLQGVETTRQTVLVVRDGDYAAPRIAVAVDAVREVSRTWLNPAAGRNPRRPRAGRCAPP